MSEKTKKSKIENSSEFFENVNCKYYPCHVGLKQLNCMFCYCPLYPLKKCPGTHHYRSVNGKEVKCCEQCIFPHQPENYEKIMKLLQEVEMYKQIQIETGRRTYDDEKGKRGTEH